MTIAWSAADLELIDAADELRIAVRRGDDTLRNPVPIWVVSVGDQVFVRTWHRRDTGWFGQVLRSRQARIGVPGLEQDVVVEDCAAEPETQRVAIDAAYRSKYERYGESSFGPMTTDAAAATTLRLSPA